MQRLRIFSQSFQSRSPSVVKKRFLQRLIELADRFLLGDAFAALQPLDDRRQPRGDSVSRFGLSASGWTFTNSGFPRICREIHLFERDRVDAYRAARSFSE